MPAAHPVRGALLCLTALALFACMDTTTKFLAERHDVPLIMAVRYLGNLLLMIVLLGPTHGRKMVQTQRTGLVLVRGMSLAVASLCIGSALQYLPVAEMTAITFLSPILLVAAAGRFLGERVGWVGWLAVLTGFAGVMLIVRPDAGLAPIGVLFVLAGVLCNLSYQFLSRVLAATEQTVALLFYTALAGSVFFGLMLPCFVEDRAPSLLDAALLASLGVYGGLGHYLFTAAFRDAPASLLAPLNYIQLLWAGLLGWLVFGHVPDALSLLGMTIVACSGVLVALRTRIPPPKRMA
jgi:drug/metabolite transporter (DMT)-like permease